MNLIRRRAFSSSKINKMDPIYLVFTDIHLKPTNIKQVKNAIEEIIGICNSYNINHVFCLGDVFDDRIAQTQSVLLAWNEIIERFQSERIEFYVIRGNHDTSDYQLDKTFLKVYGERLYYHLIDQPYSEKILGHDCHFLPFYLDDILIDELSENLQDKTGFLFGHFAVQGSKLGSRDIDSTLSRSLFKSFDKVFLGHIHDYFQVNENIFHLGSLFQNDFGEVPENKGAWIIYDDGSFQNVSIHSGQTYKKIILDVDNLSKKQIETRIIRSREDNPECRLRIELQGNKASLQSFDKSKYSDLGIDFKKKCKEIEIKEQNNSNDIKILTMVDIDMKFKAFCEERDLDYEKGSKILSQVINQK